MKLVLADVRYTGTMHRYTNEPTIEHLKPIRLELQFGKSYLFNGDIGTGAWALTWIVAGALSPQSGQIYLDNQPIDHKHLRAQSWLIRYDQVKRFGLFRQSVKSQIRAGLQKSDSSISEEKLISDFYLSPERYYRRLSQLSTEAWRASCAIGFANGRKIFCFPHLGYLRPDLMAEYKVLWLQDIVDFLRRSGALVIIPTMFSEEIAGLFDEVIDVTTA